MRVYRSSWQTQGANIPVSSDPLADPSDPVCGVVTVRGKCKCKIKTSKDGTVFALCPTHNRLAGKFTRRYHLCTKLIKHAENKESALSMLAYIVALRVVVYMMYKQAYDEKGLQDDAATNHMKPINAYETILRDNTAMDLSTLIRNIQNPTLTDTAAVPTSIEHLVTTIADQLDEDMYGEVRANLSSVGEQSEAAAADEDGVHEEPSPRQGDISGTPALTPQSASKLGRCKKGKKKKKAQAARAKPISDVSTLEEYTVDCVDVLHPLMIWKQFLQKVDSDQSVHIVLSRKYLATEMMSTNVISVLHDKVSRMYTVNIDTFYGLDALKLVDFQKLLLLNGNRDESVFHIDDVSKLDAVRFKGKLYLRFVYQDEDESQRFKDFMMRFLADGGHFEGHIRALCDIHSVETENLSRAAALKERIVSKRLLVNIQDSVQNSWIRLLQKVSAVDIEHVSDATQSIDLVTLKQIMMSERQEFLCVRSAISAVVMPNRSQSLPERWWNGIDISTQPVRIKLNQAKKQHTNLIEKAKDEADKAPADKAPHQAAVVASMSPRLLELHQSISDEIIKSMGSVKGDRAVLISKEELDERNRLAQELMRTSV